MTGGPKVSVLMPVLNEAGSIIDSLTRVLQQTVPDLEVVIADGGSEDDTVSRIRGLGDDRVRLIRNPRRLQSAGLNEALSVARGHVIVRLDARSFVAPDYVERCCDILRSTDAAVVGGRMVPWPSDSSVAKGIAIANTAWWGAGPAAFHGEGAAGPSETVYLGVFQRRWLERVGGWAEDVGVNEDYELNHRIRSAGGIVWFDPSLEVGYRPRSTLRGLARQYARYGRSKATVMRRHPSSVRVRQVLPTMLPPIALVAMGVLPGRSAARGILGAYVCAVGVLAGRSAGDPAARAASAGAAWIMHWAWSLGFWVGLVRPFRSAGRS